MEFQQLIEEIAKRTKYTKREIRSLLHTLSDVVEEELGQGGDVMLQFIGRLKNVPAGGKYVNSFDGSPRRISPPSRRVKFVVSKNIHKVVKESMHIFEEDDPVKRYLGGTSGKVRSTDRPEQSRKRKEGRSRG